MYRAGSLLLAALLAGPALALEVSPIRVALPAAATHADLWLDNTGPADWTGQARLYRWEQHGDQEQLQPADDLLVSPRLLRIPARQGQRLRVVRPGPPPEGDQRGYRLILSPDPASASATRYSLPVFLEPAGASTPLSRLRALPPQDPAAPVLRLYNDGPGHAHLADLAFIDAQGRRTLLIDGLAGYVLPHSARSWGLPPRRDGYAGGEFRARLDHAAEAPLPLAGSEIAVRSLGGL